MNAKKSLIAILPMFASIAVIGSGFSVWYFSNSKTVTGDQGTIDKDVTQLVEIGTFDIADSFKVVFDQTSEGRENNGSDLTLGDTPSGITIDFGGNTKKKTTYNEPNDGYAYDKIDGVVNFTFTTSISISTNLASYVEVDYVEGGSENNWSDGVVTSNTSNEITTFTATGYREFDWDKVSFTYKSGKEPTNREEYVTFRSVVAEAAITATYTATLINGNN